VTQTSNLSPNAQAVLLLCGQGGAGGVPPLTPGIYNKLAFWLKERVLEPAHLMEAEALALYEREPLPEVPADRLRALMGQGLGVALLVEEWQRQGGWVLCRADGAYPGRLREVLKLNAPLLLYGIGPVEILSQPGIDGRRLAQPGRGGQAVRPATGRGLCPAGTGGLHRWSAGGRRGCRRGRPGKVEAARDCCWLATWGGRR